VVKYSPDGQELSRDLVPAFSLSGSDPVSKEEAGKEVAKRNYEELYQKIEDLEDLLEHLTGLDVMALQEVSRELKRRGK